VGSREFSRVRFAVWSRVGGGFVHFPMGRPMRSGVLLVFGGGWGSAFVLFLLAVAGGVYQCCAFRLGWVSVFPQSLCCPDG
jgi:hypothetical protein